MIVMLDTSEDLDVCAKELGGLEVEELLTPLTGRTPKKPTERFAIDNGAFAKFSPKRFESLLKRELPRRELCRFVAVPDVVGSALRTLEVFERWKNRECLSGWPLALVCQDGQESLPIPWDDITAIFIGGSTEWKVSHHAAACIKAAKALDKWVHVGRINTAARYEHFEALGADSCDGTGIGRYTRSRVKLQHGLKDRQVSFLPS